MIHLRDLEIHSEDGARILEPLTLQVTESSVLGLYGPNGSGKSTLLKTLTGTGVGLLRRGDIEIDRVPLALIPSARERARKIVYLGSDFKAPFDLKVRELFELGVQASSERIWPEPTHEERGRISSVVETLGIAPFLGRSFQTLSDGEKQLMMFARVLIQAPKIVVLDETFSKLDLDRLIAVTRIIRNWAQCGMTFLIASHDLNFLSEISDHLLFLKKGRALGQGPVNAVLTEERLRELFSEASIRVVLSPESGKRKILY